MEEMINQVASSFKELKYIGWTKNKAIRTED